MPETTLHGLQSHAVDPFSEFFAKAPMMMHSVDRDGVIVAISAYWASRLGYEVKDMIGRPITDFMTPASGNVTRTEVLPKLLRVSSLDRIRHDFIRKDGSVLPVLIAAVALRSETGAFLRSLSVVTPDDGTDGLQQDLQTALIKAEDASRAKGQFLAAMSHEIRTPMNAILGFAQLLKLSDLDEKRRGHVNAIIAAGGQLMNLLTDLLDLNHMETGRLKIDARPTELRPMLEQVADWWYSSAADKGLCLKVQIDPALPTCILSDSDRLKQVLNNFLANALRYTETGSITLSVREISSGTGMSRIRMDVADTGLGISEAQQSRLFRPFVQIDSDFGKDRGGWGLGLSICHNIAKAMDAEIGVTSSLGAGSVFHFEATFPVEHVEDEPEVALCCSPSGMAESPLKILIAEDNALNQRIMEAMLLDMGHEVQVVSNGFEAVDAIVSDSFDLVLMDIAMPGLDGLGATAQIRTGTPDKSSVPIIAYSAHVESDVQARYLSAGIDDFLPKPLDPAQLQSAIARAVKRVDAPAPKRSAL